MKTKESPKILPIFKKIYKSIWKVDTIGTIIFFWSGPLATYTYYLHAYR